MLQGLRIFFMTSWIEGPRIHQLGSAADSDFIDWVEFHQIACATQLVASVPFNFMQNILRICAYSFTPLRSCKRNFEFHFKSSYCSVFLTSLRSTSTSHLKNFIRDHVQNQ